MDKFEICKETRKNAANALNIVLKKLLETNDPISEVTLRNAWLTEIRSNNNIFPDGWYTPPPHGIIILFATDNKLDRVNFTNARFEEFWPKDDILLDRKNGIVFVYASPVDKSSGIIGDFQMTLYFGKDKEIKNHLKQLYKLDKEIFDQIKIGMKFSEITSQAEKIMHKKGMSNEIISLVYNRVTNIVGHTIPDSYEVWSKQEQETFQGNDWQKIKDIISLKRTYIKDDESITVKPGMAFTIEPRPKIHANPHLPTSIGYHTIALIKENGEKELLTNFEELFQLTGMDYMI